MSAIEREPAAPGQANGAEAPEGEREPPVGGPDANEDESVAGHRFAPRDAAGGQGAGRGSVRRRTGRAPSLGDRDCEQLHGYGYGTTDKINAGFSFNFSRP